MLLHATPAGTDAGTRMLQHAAPAGTDARTACCCMLRLQVLTQGPACCSMLRLQVPTQEPHAAACYACRYQHKSCMLWHAAPAGTDARAVGREYA